MVYEPRKYWDSRVQDQGISYVGPMGDPDAAAEQFRRFGPIVGELLPADSARTLDFGCGPGRFAPLLSGRTSEYIGVDLSRVALEHADPPENGLVVWLQEDRLPFRSGHFDVGVALWVFQHIPTSEWDAWSGEFRRVVKRGGTIVVVDDLEGTAEHMFPREPETIAAALGCEIEELVTEGHHWCARLRRV